MKLTTLTLVAIFAVNYAQAEEPKKYFSALLGPAIPTSGDGNTNLVLGARLGLQAGPTSSIGISVGTIGEEATLNGITAKGRDTAILGEFVARNVKESGIYFGGRAGLVLSSATLTDSFGDSAKISDTTFGFAPVLGYETPLGEAATLQLDASWLYVGGGEADLLGTTFEYESAQNLILMIGVGFEF